MKEETGLKIDINNLQLVGVYSDPERDPREHTVSVAFLAASTLDIIKAGDDAASVELVENWRDKDLAFDHKSIIIDAWSLHRKNIKK